jgi:hypothetical protein
MILVVTVLVVWLVWGLADKELLSKLVWCLADKELLSKV